MKYNRILSFILVLMLSIGLLSGCGSGKDTDLITQDGKISIVCTTFPQYDWVRQIISGQENNFNLTLLLNSGTDLHNYQPTADDVVQIASCDIFIYVGGESDDWVHDALAESVNENMKVINMMDILGDTVKEEEVVEGMQEEEHEEDVHEEDVHEEDTEYDEHIWLSLKNAQVLVTAITDTIAETDSENADIYTKNSNDYITSLSELDAQYEQMISGAKRNVVLFGDRFPFRYLADDYNLTYYAAFPGCSAETEASFETITFLSGKIDELGLTSVIVIEGSDHKIAESIISNTTAQDASILDINSLQSVTTSDIENGITYLSVMTDNLEIFRQALY